MERSRKTILTIPKYVNCREINLKNTLSIIVSSIKVKKRLERLGMKNIYFGEFNFELVVSVLRNTEASV